MESFSAGYVHGKVTHKNAIDIRFDCFVILYLIKGNGSFVDHKGIEHQLIPGSLALRHPGKKTTLRRDNPEEWVEFAMRFPASLYSAMVKTEMINSDLTTAEIPLRDMQEKVDSFYDFLKNHSVRSGAPETLLKAQELIVDFYTKAAQNNSTEKTSSFTEKACRLLEENLESKISLEKIARKTGMTYETFRKRFKEELNDSPMDYRIKARISKARHLLAEPDMRLKEIASILGYPDVSDFSRQFKKFTGLSPQKYKKQVK